ncbi:hypothetical protein KPL71_025163 [Citrus sinensis]|uniref:Uncharacterized protein n=1 Tax=Citrus sinensis TaxID=2711 RepID=A0ACB8IYD0_CITSI|nr:hypothetical protein KPL71_025163 [Citrus sinensis]
MNATSTSTDVAEEMNGGSDSDDNAPEYYQPISVQDPDSDSDADQISSDACDAGTLPNGYYEAEVEHLNGDVEAKSSSEAEDEEEERIREESALAMRRAFREDENRRNAPLSQENARRVMDAMRRVSFRGLAPDWANRLSEDRWMDQLSRIRLQQPSTSSTNNNNNNNNISS